ncbi:MAG: hypothetical protein AB1505_36005, partial [Candidatus Latescibacterota bacterium]
RGCRQPVRTALAQAAGVALWEQPPRLVRERPPEEWDSRNLTGGPDEQMTRHGALEPRWWSPLRRAALQTGDEL